MIKTVIIEDERNAGLYLKELLSEIEPEISVEAIIPSVSEGKAWFAGNGTPDLVFADIRLEDGLVFDIFDSIRKQPQVIVTSAYDSYLMKSFEYLSIDYILKPYDKEDIRKAIRKLHTLKGSMLGNGWSDFVDAARGNSKQSIIMLEKGESVIFVETSRIIGVESDFKASKVHLEDGRTFPSRKSLKDYENRLPEDIFLKVSRQWVVNRNAIESINKPILGKVQIFLKPVYRMNPIEISRDTLSKLMDSFGKN